MMRNIPTVIFLAIYSPCTMNEAHQIGQQIAPQHVAIRVSDFFCFPDIITQTTVCKFHVGFVKKTGIFAQLLQLITTLLRTRIRLSVIIKKLRIDDVLFYVYFACLVVKPEKFIIGHAVFSRNSNRILT